MSSPAPVINWKKNLLFIWLSQLLSMAGFSSAMPFIPLYIKQTWGITSEQELGIWMSAFYFFGMVSFCISTPIWGILADRFGRKLMLLRACYIDAVLFPCFLLAPNPAGLIVVRFIASAFTGTVSAAQTLIVTTTPEEHHGFALGTLLTAIWSGALVGYAAGGLIVHYFGFTVAFIGCGAMYLLAGLFAHIFVQDAFHTPTPKEQNSMRNSWSGISIGIWGICFLIVITAVARKFDEPYIALMVESIQGGLDTAFHTGWICALAALGGIFSGMIIGRLCDKFSPYRIATPCLFIAGITMALQAFSDNLAYYSIFRFLNYLAAAGLEAVFLTILSKISPENLRGTVFGLSSGLRMGGILFSSAASGVIVYYYGVKDVYLAAGVIFLITIPCFWAVMKIIRKQQRLNTENDMA